MCNREAQHRYLTQKAEKVCSCNASQAISALKFEYDSRDALSGV